MVRASTLLDGITAPVVSGFSIQERRKCTSSSKRSGRFSARAMDCGRIVTTLPAPSNYCHAYRAQRGGSSSCSRLPAASHAVDELFDLAEESHGLRLGVVR